MNAERFLEVYEQISEAPDAIARLRRFVLDLAVRGKLVEQDAEDEPAGTLIKEIRRTKEAQIKAKEIKKPKPLEPLADYPFDVPTSWIWEKLGNITSYIQRGKSPKYYPGSGIPVVSQKCVQWAGLDMTVAKEISPESFEKYEAIRLLRTGDLLWNSTGTGTIGRVLVLQNPPKNLVCDSHVTVVRPIHLNSSYLHVWLRCDHVYGQIEGSAAGSTNQIELTATLALNQPVPIPPLAEQRRIVAKVDELMALCDRLEEARKTREEVRDKLTAASLARLTAPDTSAEDLPTHAAFALEALPALTSRPDQIKTLRQTILNLAVRGKLVEQDPVDEPVAKLLMRISNKRAELVKTGEAKKLKPRKDDAWPFAIPGSWSWCALGEVSSLVTKGSSPKWQGVGYVDKDAGLLFITSENVGNFTLRKLDELKYVEARFKDIEPRSMLRRGDLLINLVGASIGRSAVYDLDDEANINQAVALVRMTDPEDCPSLEYLLKYLNSELAVDLMLGSRVTTAQPNISLTDVAGFPVPLPPLAEQHRIVAKVDALMAICDRLEAALTTTDTTRTRLLEALLHEALAPATDTPEAAE